ncbi:MAG: bifunctional ADP-dependent NAD(P)H-hydrate dehydratase/NAD(P)H-hydrate epimerase, partial [Actinomycetota bacterium]|nr:bifunctional ADP-dependent NAD(P)H-hydrate dehydratase/NAD(P)H-hydrate epimerase [Actinomycetota bacterium]
MIPVLTPEEMKAVDRAAPEPLDVLVERAGTAVARAALSMLGGGYGRRVVVVAGKGNNGADGRVAADRLRRRGVRVAVIDAADQPDRLPPADLVIDAAFGTGFRGDYRAPDPGGAPVLAVDIPSGVDGLTGEVGRGAVRATATLTFAALKPGLLLGAGADHAGRVSVADIGLDVSRSTIGLVEGPDVASWMPDRQRESHKWKAAIWMVAGSPGMTGAADMAARAAMRSGSGSVRLGVPGQLPALRFPEVIGRELPAEGWDAHIADLDRMKALVIGPGLGRSDATAAAVRGLLATAKVPVVVDADALYALGTLDDPIRFLRARPGPTILTPHDGEFSRLVGCPPGPRRISAVRHLAFTTGATVLLKGSTTVVADPSGDVLLT